MAFGKATQRNIGTALTGIGANGAGKTPGPGKAWVVFGAVAANKSGKANVVNIALRESGNVDTYLLPDLEFPAAEANYPIGSLSKVVMLPGDVIVASSTEGGLHLSFFYVEVDQ